MGEGRIKQEKKKGGSEKFSRKGLEFLKKNRLLFDFLILNTHPFL